MIVTILIGILLASIWGWIIYEQYHKYKPFIDEEYNRRMKAWRKKVRC